MEFEIPKSKVYIQTDDQGRILRCEGGYTTPSDLTGWICIDEGTGDRYNLCQSHYFDGGTYTQDGIPRYKLENGAAVLRSDDEIAEDRKPPVETVRADTLRALSGACNAAITAGMDVETSLGKGHFSLQETDQINLTAAVSAVQQGADSYPYHADGQMCRRYPAGDILSIGAAATRHKLYHTTYCNHMMTWARRAETAEELAGIIYGAALPEDLAKNMAEVLEDAAGGSDT